MLHALASAHWHHSCCREPLEAERPDDVRIEATMDLTELKVEMDDRFKQVDKRFEQVDKRFEQVDKQFIELRHQIAAEAEKTRRHFDVVADQMKAERNLALDSAKATDERLVRISASNASDHAEFEVRLQDHEKRLGNLEGQ